MALVRRAGHWVGCFCCGFTLFAGCQAPQARQPAALAARLQPLPSSAEKFDHNRQAVAAPITTNLVQRTSARLLAVDCVDIHDEHDIVLCGQQELLLDLLVDQALARNASVQRLNRSSDAYGSRTAHLLTRRARS